MWMILVDVWNMYIPWPLPVKFGSLLGLSFRDSDRIIYAYYTVGLIYDYWLLYPHSVFGCFCRVSLCWRLKSTFWWYPDQIATLGIPYVCLLVFQSFFCMLLLVCYFPFMLFSLLVAFHSHQDSSYPNIAFFSVPGSWFSFAHQTSGIFACDHHPWPGKTWENSTKWRFFHGKMICKWWIFHVIFHSKPRLIDSYRG